MDPTSPRRTMSLDSLINIAVRLNRLIRDDIVFRHTYPGSSTVGFVIRLNTALIARTGIQYFGNVSDFSLIRPMIESDDESNKENIPPNIFN